MTVAEKALKWAIAIANDQSHGYSQSDRWGPNYDCSSLVISAYRHAGVSLNAVYTGDLRQGCLAAGFKDVTSKVDLNTGSGLKKGDILMYHIGGTAGHTAMYAGNGQIVHARGQSYGSPASGDQGSEIAVTAYYRSKWQYVLRYPDKDASDDTPEPTPTKKRYTVTTTLPIIMYGDMGSAVKVWQTIIGVNADSEFGDKTKAATLAFQKAHSLEQDAEVGPLTWSAGFETLS